MYQKDEHGLGTGNIPYIPVKITVREFEILKNKNLEFYETDGRKLFQERDREGNVVGYIFYVMGA